MPELKEFIVNVGPNGTFNKSGKYQTVPGDIDNIFARFEKDGIRKISLYFHGGLVNEENGIKSAKNVEPYISRAGCAPVCFVWETGLIETISSNISKISETKLFNKLLKVLLKKITQKIGFDTPSGRGIGGKGLTDAEIELQLSQPDPFNEFNRSSGSQSRNAVNLQSLTGKQATIEAELKRDFTLIIEKDPEFLSAIQNSKLTVEATGNKTGSRGVLSIASFVLHVVKIAYRVISRFIDKRDHDLYPTIVEEILREFYIAEVGAWVWKAMKDKASGMWESNDGRNGLNQYAGRYFLDKLAAYKKTYPDTEIHLVGHSAGAIVICQLLKFTASLAAGFSFDHILFMAPACRAELFKKEMLDDPSRFKDLRIFTMSDEYECKDLLVPYFYTHSLLYLIAGILEDEGASNDAFVLGLQRHIAFSKPYDIPDLDGIHRYIYENGQDRSSFSVTISGTIDGLATEAKSHGGFDDDVVTLKSIQHVLQ